MNSPVWNVVRNHQVTGPLMNQLDDITKVTSLNNVSGHLEHQLRLLTAVYITLAETSTGQRTNYKQTATNNSSFYHT